MKTKLIRYGSPLLRKNCEEVKREDNVKEYVDLLFNELEMQKNGIGLAAPQVGLLKRIFLVKGIGVMINPEVHLSGEMVEMVEGCLSIPSIHEAIKRPSTVTITYYTEDWEKKVEEYSGMFARVIQHENDHINGVLFIDYLSPLKKRMLAGKLKAISKL